MIGAHDRRGFLRGLVSLPLVGGGVTLIGNPVAAAEPVTKALLDSYDAWLDLECSDPEVAAAIAAYCLARDQAQSASEALDAANERHGKLGGRVPAPAALHYRDEDHAVGLGPHLATWVGDVRQYRQPTISWLRQHRWTKRIEESRPEPFADGFTVRHERQPEAQARADEIVAAWDWRAAETRRRLDESGVMAAEEADEAANEARHAAALALATTPARTLAGIQAKVAIILEIYDGDREDFLKCGLGASADDDRITASIVHDLMAMAGTGAVA